MPKDSLPLWLQYANAIAVPLVGVLIAGIGAWIAWQQVRIAHVRLQHELYEPALQSLRGTRKLLSTVFIEGNATNDAIQSYLVAIIDAVFLFDDDLCGYLDEIKAKAATLHGIKAPMEGKPPQDERAAAVLRSEEPRLWLVAQRDILAHKFKPFLTLEEYRHPARRGWRWLLPRRPTMCRRKSQVVLPGGGLIPTTPTGPLLWMR
jgi:hypothetical protein